MNVMHDRSLFILLLIKRNRLAYNKYYSPSLLPSLSLSPSLSSTLSLPSFSLRHFPSVPLFLYLSICDIYCNKKYVKLHKYVCKNYIIMYIYRVSHPSLIWNILLDFYNMKKYFSESESETVREVCILVKFFLDGGPKDMKVTSIFVNGIVWFFYTMIPLIILHIKILRWYKNQ